MKLAVLVIALVACSKDKPPQQATRGSCQSSPLVCEDYESTDAKYVKRQRDACNGVGTWSDAACPTANLVGSCREAHGWTRTRHYYRGVEGQENPAVAKAKIECGGYGTWVEPGN